MQNADSLKLVLTAIDVSAVPKKVIEQLPPAEQGETFSYFKLVVPEIMTSIRIDRLLGLAQEVGSRSQATRLAVRGLVFQNGSKLKPASTVRAQTEVLLCIPQVPKDSLVAYEFPLHFLYEDEDLLVVEKPSGLVVHPAYGHAQDTLVNALLYHRKDLSQGFDQMRPGLVHRIDKETSGLLLIAKNERAQRTLALQFQRKETHRLYRAFVFGVPRQTSGRIESHLSRHAVDRRRSASNADGKLAITHYKVIQEYNKELSLIELKLETGRTHQIRVHMTELGHPLVGDSLYGGDRRLSSLKSKKLRDLVKDSGRFFLHAYQLGFYHPRSGRYILAHTPWPNDLLSVIEHCEIASLPQREIRVGSSYSEVRFDFTSF